MSQPAVESASGGACASEIVACVVAAFEGLAGLPEVCHQLTGRDLAGATRLVLGLLQRAEQVSIALTGEAVSQGVVNESTAVSTKQWVQRLATGEPLEHLQPVASSSGPLVSYDDQPGCSADLPGGSSSEGAQRGTVLTSAQASEPFSSDPAAFPRMPGLEGPVAHRIASLATRCRLGRNQVVREALRGEETSPAVAQVALTHAETMSTLLPGMDRSEVLGLYLMLPVGHTSRDARALTQLVIATHGGPELLDKAEAAQDKCESLSWRTLPTGMVELIAQLSAGHAAQVRRAIEAMSAPMKMRERRDHGTDHTGARGDPGDCDAADGDQAATGTSGGTSDDADEHGSFGSGNAFGGPDLRPAGKRRADALLELLAIAARAVDEGSAPSVGAARLVITFDYQALAGALGRSSGSGSAGCGSPGSASSGSGSLPHPGTAGAGTAGGPPRRHLHAGLTGGGGELIDPGTIRRLACDAELIPMVLGRDGVPLDVGKEERLYTRSLRQAVINRDRGCTFPGCDRPSSFCQVHHILPWWCGGETTLPNGALLCGRHHTIVHRDRLTADLVHGRIEWDLTPGRMPLIPAHHPAA